MFVKRNTRMRVDEVLAKPFTHCFPNASAQKTAFLAPPLPFCAISIRALCDVHVERAAFEIFWQRRAFTGHEARRSRMNRRTPYQPVITSNLKEPPRFSSSSGAEEAKTSGLTKSVLLHLRPCHILEAQSEGICINKRRRMNVERRSHLCSTALNMMT